MEQTDSVRILFSHHGLVYGVHILSTRSPLIFININSFNSAYCIVYDTLVMCPFSKDIIW